MAEELERIAKELRDGQEVSQVTVREFLRWYGAKRRGYWIVQEIEDDLGGLRLKTVPNFVSAYLDGPISFVVDTEERPQPPDPPEDDESEAELVAVNEAVQALKFEDPTYQISKLAAANQLVISIAPNGSVEQAVTLLMSHDFSQLPVMTNPREVKGIVTWKSIVVSKMLNQNPTEARHVMVAHHEVKRESSMFDAIPTIVTHDYVLVRGADQVITGIITASDLNRQFKSISEPFLLLGEIENMVRQIIQAHFDVADMQAAKDPNDLTRTIGNVSDLTFGEYIRLLDKPENWRKLGISLDRRTFCETMDQVREIRNDVMHFDPDGIPEDDINRLRECTSFLKQIRSIL